MSQTRALSSDEVRGLREELAAGGTPTVWFTSSAVGVQEGRSGKVTALDEPAEGDFIQVRPAGSKDVLSFSAGEVTVVKPARRSKDTGAAAKSGAAKSGGAGKSGSTAKSGSGDKPTAKAAATESASRPETTESVADGPAKPNSSKGTSTTSSASTGAARTDTAARRKPRQPAGASVTLTAGSDGQWSVEVSNGKKRVLRPMVVPASAVAHAAKALHEDVAQAVEPLLEAAREHQRARVEQLQQELSEAQRMLDDLSE
ncbi:DUF6319 family protein [Haloactinomyces albus]|uniref:Cell wall anchor protein n=1 Tax=Haloactinomyces albus TaxID=1352928 RepID=A0AAE4CLB6_9ACTN|nr:DUF6319 family protein [Haloactinomyces albus]MDR7301181.1 hypothetical protein [Haloactinomyces albus]